MSETLRLGVFLTLAGGFMDAYSYICRGKVFANAQTGNIVLLGQSLAEADFSRAVSYLLPIISFAVGVYLCQKIQLRYKNMRIIHWRQLVLAIEIVFVVIIGFLSKKLDSPANMMIRSEEHTSELQSRQYLVCRLLLEKKKKKKINFQTYTIIYLMYISYQSHLNYNFP